MTSCQKISQAPSSKCLVTDTKEMMKNKERKKKSESTGFFYGSTVNTDGVFSVGLPRQRSVKFPAPTRSFERRAPVVHSADVRKSSTKKKGDEYDCKKDEIEKRRRNDG